MVIFRSMEGPRRAQAAFEFNYYRKVVKKWCKPIYKECISTEKLENLAFRDKLLNVEMGVEPELLNWANYSVSTPEKILRQLIYGVWVICTLYACFWLIFELEAIIQNAEIAAPTITCKDDITPEMAEIDYNKKMFYRNGDFNCYCEKLSTNESVTAMREFAFPVSGEKKCHEWEKAVFNLAVLPNLIAIVMGIVNFITEQVVKAGTKYIKKPLDENQAIIGNMRGITWQQYIGLALIYPVIYMNQKLYIIPNPPGIL